MENQPLPSLCPNCQAILLPDTHFCPNCGFQILPVSHTIGIWRQVWIYFVSLAFPPFGFIWTWKYFRSSDASLKRVAIIATVLTIISVMLTIWWTVGFFNAMSQQINAVSNFGY